MAVTAHEIRGGAVGALTGALAIAAHGIAGGGVPSSSSLTFLLASSIVLGVLAGATVSRTPGPLALLAWLAVGQCAGHWALSLEIGPAHSAMTDHSVGPMMLLAHALAVTACAALVYTGERLWGPITSVLRAPLLTLAALPAAPSALRPVTDTERVRVLDVASSTISRRGPPRVAAV